MSRISRSPLPYPPQNLLALAICMATITPALADDSAASQQQPAPGVIELGASEITSNAFQLGSYT